MQNGKEFLENSVLVDSNNIKEATNFKFLTKIINDFQVKNIDFLACNTLQYSEWKLFYQYLNEATGVIVGASNDKTGNIKYGADWLLESTNENIKNVYFNSNIDNYTSYLDYYKSHQKLIFLIMIFLKVLNLKSNLLIISLFIILLI